jgi:hypothetical protein
MNDFSDFKQRRAQDGVNQRLNEMQERQDGADFAEFPQRKRSRPDDDEELQTSWIQGSRPPPPLLISDVMPGALMKMILSGNYACATDSTGSRSTSDGVIWLPMAYGGPLVVRCLLALAGTVVSNIQATIVPPLASDTAANGFTLTGMTLTLTNDLMLPAAVSLAGAFISVGNDVTTNNGLATGNFSLARCTSGELRIFSNTGNNAGNIITGEIGGAQLGGSYNILDFNRNNAAARSNFGKNAVVARQLSDGLKFNFPANPPLYGTTSRQMTESRGELISTNSFSATDFIFVSHVGTATATGGTALTNIALAQLPWGAHPNFTFSVRGAGASGGGPGITTSLRAVHVYASFSATGVTVTTQNTAVCIHYSGNDNTYVDILPQPFNGVLDVRNGMWVGAFMYLDIPNASIAAIVGNIATWLPAEQEKRLSNPAVARMDNVSSGVTIVVAGTIYSQCVVSGLNVSVANSVACTPIDPRSVADQQDLLTQFFSDDVRPTRLTVSAPATK